MQFCFYAVFSLAEMRHEARRISLKSYLFLALATLVTIGFSNASLGYLNYPTQVIFKCCKLIPVLVGGILIQGKRYGPLDFLAAGLMSVGLIVFTLADVNVMPNFDATGILMICTALVADAVIGNVQEKEMRQHGASSAEVVFYSYAIGSVYLVGILLCTGHLTRGAAYFNEEPVVRYGSAFLFSASGYFGIQVRTNPRAA